MSVIDELFGMRVRMLRLQHELTQGELASMMTDFGCPMSQVKVAKVEHGARPCTVREVVALSRALRVPTARLFGERASCPGDDS